METETKFEHTGSSPRIEVYCFSDQDRLQAERWVFSYFPNSHTLRVSQYSVLEKPTKRHKYKVVKNWDRLEKRSNTIDIPKEPYPDVVNAAQDSFSENLFYQSL